MIRGWPHHIVKILELLESFQPKRCVEIGTYCGASAIPIAKSIRAWNGTLTCVDPWVDKAIMWECVENICANHVSDTVLLFPTESVKAATTWQGPVVDFLYIDGDHSYEAVKADLNAWWPHLRPGALLCGDDYDDPLSPGVARAWNEFEREHGIYLEHFATANTNPPGMKLVWGVK